jgi:hypothetical protein
MMEIIIGWILMGIFCCWIERNHNETKGQQLLIIIFAPIIVLFGVFDLIARFGVFDLIARFMDSPAIGRKE